MEESIRKKGAVISLVDDVANILSKEWIGTADKIDYPLYHLKKIYKYDVDRNSGFSKGFWEKSRDTISDNAAQWTIGTVVTGIIGIILAIIFKS